MSTRKKCARCDLPPAPPSKRFCDTHRREHGQALRDQLTAIQVRVGDIPKEPKS